MTTLINSSEIFNLNVEMELERQRRIDSLAESYLRRMNAQKTANMIHNISWPLILPTSTTRMAYSAISEEAERSRRMADSVEMILAKNNASIVSLLIRVAFQSGPYLNLYSNSKAYTRFLMEKERARRLADNQELDLASFRSHLVASLIRQLGWPFYVQSSIIGSRSMLERASLLLESAVQKALPVGRTAIHAAYVAEGVAEETLHTAIPVVKAGATIAGRRAVHAVHVAEDAADRALEKTSIALSGAAAETFSAVDRALDTTTNAMTRFGSLVARAVGGLADSVSEAFHPASEDSSLSTTVVFDAALEEELERVRRMASLDEEYRAKLHARFVSAMIYPNISPATENERRRRLVKSVSNQDRMVANRLAWSMEGLFLTRRTSTYLIEHERQNRIRDKTARQMAIANARKVSSMILERAPVVTSTVSLENEERMRRLYDRSSQILAKKNARATSRLIERKFAERQATYESVPFPAPTWVTFNPAPTPMHVDEFNIADTEVKPEHATVSTASIAPALAPIPFIEIEDSISEELFLPRATATNIAPSTVEPAPVLVAEPEATVDYIALIVESAPVLAAEPQTITTTTTSSTITTITSNIAPLAVDPAPVLVSEPEVTTTTYFAPVATTTYDAAPVAPVYYYNSAAPITSNYVAPAAPVSYYNSVAPITSNYVAPVATAPTSTASHHGIRSKLHDLKAHRQAKKSQVAKSGQAQM